MTVEKYERRTGVRFQYLLRQLDEEGMSQTAIAAAIGCHQTLISKWWWRGTLDQALAQKGLRDDVMQGIYEGLHVRLDYLVMPKPRGYPNRVRLPNGETRPAEPDELDYKDFRVISNDEFERARDRKEREAMKGEVTELREQVALLSSNMAQLMALLAKEKQSAR